ncbi:MAG: sigma-54 dependent transcriptional regulator [Acidobacteriota bacterium]|nr:sigma-54 dependent transcriptional regulator [Acidobacteriota bacterium]MDH3783737.1 sigma-54 dependent transcriptional regulator [Acidobacteriota bacterium]
MVPTSSTADLTPDREPQSGERVLLVEDEKLIRWSIRTHLEEHGFVVAEAEDGAKANKLLRQDEFDLLVLDHRLPDTTGLDILRDVRAQSNEVAVIMMTAFGSVEKAVEAIKLGAYEYLTKPVNLEHLLAVAHKALETTRLKRQLRRLQSERRETHASHRLIGTSPAMRQVLERVDRVSGSRASIILLQGESGTGKNVVARAIHYGSPRVDAPFVNITCSALTASLLESELFGHEKGAFTDAKERKQGLLEVADGGTVFLDEIGEMPPALQAKLLRFLEDRTFKRVGGTRDIEVDVRIIAATNRNLTEAVKNGEFREDLFYRLNVIPIGIPALRERREDISLLTQHFIDGFNEELRTNCKGIRKDALDRMMAHEWPGNVRELRNVIERILILEDKEWITLADLPAEVRGDIESHQSPSTDDPTLPVGKMTLEQIECSAIREALRRCDHNQVQAARLLGLSRDTLRYRIKKFKIDN